MEFVGKVILDLPMESGTSRTGNPWRKKSWVLETFDQYPKKVKVDAFGNGVDNVRMELMKVYQVSVDAESREFNNRWYTDLRVYRAVETVAPGAGASAPAQSAPMSANPFTDAPAGFPSAPAEPAAFEDAADDLPF